MTAKEFKPLVLSFSGDCCKISCDIFRFPTNKSHDISHYCRVQVALYTCLINKYTQDNARVFLNFFGEVKVTIFNESQLLIMIDEHLRLTDERHKDPNERYEACSLNIFMVNSS